MQIEEILKTKYSETNLVNYVRSYGALENEQELFLEFVKVSANSIKVLYSKQKTHFLKGKIHGTN